MTLAVKLLIEWWNLMLQFRNLNVSPSDPVHMWGVEGILTALERGDVRHWHAIVTALDSDQADKVATDLAQAVECTESPSMKALMSRQLQKRLFSVN